MFGALMFRTLLDGASTFTGPAPGGNGSEYIIRARRKKRR